MFSYTMFSSGNNCFITNPYASDREVFIHSISLFSTSTYSGSLEPSITIYSGHSGQIPDTVQYPPLSSHHRSSFLSVVFFHTDFNWDLVEGTTLLVLPNSIQAASGFIYNFHSGLLLKQRQTCYVWSPNPFIATFTWSEC